MMSIRKLSIFVALLAIIIGGAPYFTGYLAEAKFKEVVKVLSELDSASIEVVKYKRGWRHSFAETKVTVASEYSEPFIESMDGLDSSQKLALKTLGFSLTLDHEIQHGPFVLVKSGDWKGWRFALATFHSRVLLSDDVKQILEKLLGQTKLLEIDGKISIEGAVHVDIDSFPIKLTAADGSDYFNFQGGNASWKLSRDMKHFQADLDFPGVVSRTASKSFSFSSLKGNYDEHKSPEGLWLGDIKFDMGAAAIRDLVDPTNNVDITNLSVDSTSDSQSGLVAGDCHVNFEKVMVGGDTYGPFALTFSIKRFDGGFLKEVMDFSKNIRTATPQSQAEMAQKLLAKSSDLLKHRPEVNLDKMSLKTTEGEITADLHLAFGGENAKDVNNTAQIFQSIAASAKTAFPKVVFNQILTKQFTNQAIAQAKSLTNTEPKQEDIDQQVSDKVKATVDSAIKDGYIVEKDNMYISEWSYENSELKVNGKVMTYPFASVPAVGGGAPASTNEGSVQ